MVTTERSPDTEPAQSGPELVHLTDDAESDATVYKTYGEALQAGAISKEDASSLMKAEMDYGIARKQFVDKYDAIGHEKMAHDSVNLPRVIREAAKALLDYDDKVSIMNTTLRKHGVEERSALKGTMFDDDHERIKLDEMVRALDLQATRDEVADLEGESTKPGLELVGKDQ